MKCYIDMDGVLADFYGGVCFAFGREPWPYPATPGNQNWHDECQLKYATILRHMTREFNELLAWTPEGKKLIDLAAHLFGYANCAMLTAPWPNCGNYIGKIAWADAIGWGKKVIFAEDKSLVAHPDALLIDDRDDNVAAFRSAGGKAVLVPRPWNSRHAEALDADRNLIPVDWRKLIAEVL